MNMTEPHYESIFVARQPVFHTDETVWGYELLFRSGEENVARITDQSHATSSVIADGLSMAVEGLPGKAHILINFPEQMLTSDVGFVLPKETCVIEILEDVRPSRETLKAVRRLKDAGYTVAVDDFFGQKALRPFIELADIVKIDILALDSDPARVRQAVDGLALTGKTLLAEKVEDAATFKALRAMGFSLFQGFFFSKPEIIPGKKLTTNETTKLQLLSELSKPDFEAARLAEILQSDPNLSYRLFRYINSAGFSLRQKVTSLKRAIDMMGMIQATQWLRTALLADLNPTPKAGELALIAVHRAKFLASFCSSKSGVCIPDAMFLSGLFSLLDAMLGVEMDQILDHLPLEETVVNGLTTEGEVQDMLSLAASYEQGDWEQVAKYLDQVGLTQEQGDALYADAGAWARKMLDHSQNCEDD